MTTDLQALTAILKGADQPNANAHHFVVPWVAELTRKSDETQANTVIKGMFSAIYNLMDAGWHPPEAPKKTAAAAPASITEPPASAETVSAAPASAEQPAPAGSIGGVPNEPGKTVEP